ncbi:MAG: DUF1287 domain-containing protein [Desulfobacteraceae bacterium]|nr:MAG: DUF1287 domain-containing protein [Desulfobacteraceae bacterium]
MSNRPPPSSKHCGRTRRPWTRSALPLTAPHKRGGRRQESLTHKLSSKNNRPGDIVTCIVPPRLPHIMIVSDKKNRDGIPFVIHNIGAGAQEEDRLFEFELTGHYRIVPIEQQDTG